MIIDIKNRKIVASLNEDIEEYFRNLKVPFTIRGDGYIIVKDEHIDKEKIKTDLGLS